MGTVAGDKQEDTSAKVTTMTTLKGSMGERITKALGKVEEKKKRRAQRKAQVIIVFIIQLVKTTISLHVFHATAAKPC